MYLDDTASLLRKCQRGDASALTQLVRRLEGRIYQLARRVVGDAALAEEATVVVLYKIWTKAGQWRGDTNAETWIYRIAVRTVLDLRRGRRRWWSRFGAAISDNEAERRPGPAEKVVESEEALRREQRLQQALAQLGEADRALIHLYYSEERSLPELEEILGTNSATLKMRLARARARLRAMWEPHDDAV
jgi:RNA polymerase sigma-70 factor (ECF subfamily)